MTIPFVAKSHVNGSLTGTEPTGTAKGDVMIAVLDEQGATTAHTGPAGWTQIDQSNYGTGSNRGSAWWIIRGASAPSFAWTGPVAAAMDIDIFTYRGVTVAPIDDHLAAVRASSTTPLSPSVTSTVANDLLLAILFVEAINSSVVTQPTGMTSRQDGFAIGDDIFVADLALGAAGATGTKQWTLDAADATFAVAIALSQGPTLDTSVVDNISSTSKTTSMTIAANTDRVLFVEVAIGGTTASVPVTSVTWGGVSLSLLIADEGLNSGVPVRRRTELWYLLNPASGTANIVTTMSASIGFSIVGASYYNTVSLGTAVSTSGGGGTSASLTPGSNLGDLVVGSLVNRGTGTITTSNALTTVVRNQITNTNLHQIDGVTPGSATSTTVGYTWTGADAYAFVAVALRPVASGGSNTTITPAVLAMTLSFFTPVENQTLTPSVLAMSLSFFTPTINIGQTIVPSVLAMSLSFFTPTIVTPQTVTPSVLSLALSFFTPLEDTRVIPSVLGLTLSFFTPLVVINQTVTPSVLSMSLSFFTPVVTATSILFPTTLALTLSFFTPTLSGSQTLTPTILALTLGFFTPGLNQTTTPSVLSMSLAFFTPVIKTGLTPSILSLALSFFTPTITQSANNYLTPTLLSLTLGLFTPLIVTPQTLAPSVLALVLGFLSPTISSAASGIMLPNAGATYTTNPIGMATLNQPDNNSGANLSSIPPSGSARKDI